MFIISKTDYFYFWFLHNSDLRISTAGKNKKILKLNTSENNNIFHNIDQITRLQGYRGNRPLLSLQKWSLDILLTVPL